MDLQKPPVEEAKVDCCRGLMGCTAIRAPTQQLVKRGFPFLGSECVIRLPCRRTRGQDGARQGWSQAPAYATSPCFSFPLYSIYTGNLRTVYEQILRVYFPAGHAYSRSLRSIPKCSGWRLTACTAENDTRPPWRSLQALAMSTSLVLQLFAQRPHSNECDRMESKWPSLALCWLHALLFQQPGFTLLYQWTADWFCVTGLKFIFLLLFVFGAITGMQWITSHLIGFNVSPQQGRTASANGSALTARTTARASFCLENFVRLDGIERWSRDRKTSTEAAPVFASHVQCHHSRMLLRREVFLPAVVCHKSNILVHQKVYGSCSSSQFVSGTYIAHND